MGQTVETYRWSVSEFLRGRGGRGLRPSGRVDRGGGLAGGHRGLARQDGWEGHRPAFRVRRRRDDGDSAERYSLPDPDCWVRRPHAEPAGQLGTRLSLWRPGDVLLVVEVSDDTVVADQNIKSRIYGSAGWPVYWVVTEEAIYEHTEPHSAGYRVRREYRRGDRLPIVYTGTDVAVDDLLGPEPQL